MYIEYIRGIPSKKKKEEDISKSLFSLSRVVFDIGWITFL